MIELNCAGKNQKRSGVVDGSMLKEGLLQLVGARTCASYIDWTSKVITRGA